MYFTGAQILFISQVLVFQDHSRHMHTLWNSLLPLMIDLFEVGLGDVI
uniref:Uncharacterized protein n=1 Tax=Rhizophora mucronata TaxID=61149 RepID=A0A2P2J3W3_RHIMU